MTAKTWMIALGAASSLSLGIGIPVVAVTAHTSTQLVSGPVTSVDPRTRAIVLRAATGQASGQASGPASGQAQTVTLHLPAGERIGMAGGGEQLGDLVPGQMVQARVSTRAGHWARWVKLTG